MKTTKLHSRRSFINKMARGTALSAIAVSSASRLYSESATETNEYGSADQKPIRIGIIGAENSHTIGYGRLFNVDKKFPGVEVLYVWGETDEFASAAMEKGNIPNIVKDPKDMLGRLMH